MPELQIPNPEPVVIAKATPTYERVLRYLGIVGMPILGIILIFFLLAPVDFYLKLYSLFSPQALKINSKPASWDELKKETKLVDFDKNLKTRGQKLQAAIDNIIELQILRSASAAPPAFSQPLTLFAEHRSLRDQIEQTLVNWRSGGYFIARFKVPQATESAEIMKDKAKTQLTKLQQKLKNGEEFNKLLEEASQNATLKSLNENAFTPGMYFTKITPQQFPLKLKGFRDQFFALKEGQISNILTLSWDDYDGPSYVGNKLSGEFAYAVIKIDGVNSSYSQSYDEWLSAQKQKIKAQSFVWIPFFFNWF